MSIVASGTLLGGRYLLDRPIAEGGMGAVWRARHLKLDIPVAVKLMAPALAASSTARARFEREAKAAARLKSPHLVEVHDYGVEGDAPYIVMEHLDGEDLSSRLAARGHLGVDETAEIVGQVAKALEIAHAADVVHRDLKPGNVFLARAGREEIVKVLDFGVAKLRADPGATATLPGMLMGSPGYMSPEQARGERALDHRSDLWSLGVVAFQCLTGRLPFDEEDITALIIVICSSSAPAASSVAPWLEPTVDRFFERALARLPGDRFQSARATWPPPSRRWSTSSSASCSRNGRRARGGAPARPRGDRAALPGRGRLFPRVRRHGGREREARRHRPRGRGRARAPRARARGRTGARLLDGRGGGGRAARHRREPAARGRAARAVRRDRARRTVAGAARARAARARQRRARRVLRRSLRLDHPPARGRRRVRGRR